MVTTPADRIATIERGLRRTSTNLLDELRTTGNTDPLRARRLTRAMLDVDRATQDVHVLALDAQIHILQDPDQSLDRLVAQAETIRERARQTASDARQGHAGTR